MEALLAAYEPHCEHIAKRARTRREAVALRAVVNDGAQREAVTVEESLGKWQPGDELQGDVNFRTLRSLLKLVDEKGFERSPHQLKFHAAFERAAARVIYRDSWGTQRPKIMKAHGWKTTPGEVLISTPRRFGKTFRQALPCPVLVHARPPKLTQDSESAASPSSSPASR
tara:strand:+ start:278 stop:787 length:510 start_codon:yes stop_codon:yes gene_type:complete